MNRLVSSKLTSKFQATVPKEVRETLRLSAKDQIVYEILEDKTVIIRKASSLDKAYLKGLDHTLDEWSSEEDEKAYKDL
ncbi:MAG: type II toxin-antitoxin system PrlF family antitoxin [Chlamydiia bacterium]|nr:type II toxin-antitoxin system PrlF family antitoxin [Chlamydiia bacterium]